MIPDFCYLLKDEDLYYKISNQLIELYSLEKEEKNNLIKGIPNPPVLHTYRPSINEINEYTNKLLKYQEERDKYNIPITKLNNNKKWKELINTYVHRYYSSNIPIGLIENFVFNKYKNKEYSFIFQEYIEMLHWFETNNVSVTEEEQSINRLPIYKIKNKKPDKDSFIYIVNLDNIQSYEDIISGKVEIHWFEFDKDNQFTGNQILFEDESFLPLFIDDGSVYHYEKVYLVNGYELTEDQMWFYQKDLFNILLNNTPRDNETTT